ncbi:EmrB/QacA subfamily drug resistance transporter [Deinococcus metalli]|uniref:EmrB/QacA subfamily drug resistance transporter n=1 Tax=Deinococcus metalli TaxID=1141878 RepID=A0A7W8NQB2_9DEIO|nr:MFS transporter [Deinococcus metalli]MBB5377706.1 EmrB/QacA subfamily drug resistance transporter [Deinococcus metalli]GHF52711.1 MFS transporter [Deinococcus metalli]
MSTLHEKFSYKWLALSVTSLGALMASMNSGTLIIALPTLLRDLHTTLLSLIWILLAYNVTQTVFVLNVGRLSDMLGRKRLYVLGFGVFTLASLLAGFTAHVPLLIALRALQGVGGAFMLANSSAIVTDAFPKKELGFAIGTNQMMVAVGAILGPIIGGALTALGWQWVFWFNVPLGILGTLWAAFTLRDLASKQDRNDAFDWWGNLTYAAGFALLMIGLSQGGIESWNGVLGYLVVGVAALALFTVIEGRVRAPMLDLRLFRDRAFTLNNATVFLNAVSRMALTFLFVFYFQGGKGIDAVVAGIMLAPVAVGLLIASPVAGRLSDRMDPRTLIQWGLVLGTLALAGIAVSLSLSTPYWLIAALMFVAGVGNGLFNSPNSSLIMGSVAPDRRGVAAGVRSLLMSVGGVVAIIFTLSIVVSAVPRDIMLQVFSGLSSTLPAATLNPFIDGLKTAFWMLAGVSAVSAALAYVIPAPRPAGVTAQAAD